MASLSKWFENLLFGGPREDGAAAAGPGGDAEKITAVTVIGSGGKTSLIWHLAVSLAAAPDKAGEKTSARKRKILVTPTTKMNVPPEPAKLYDRYYDGKSHNWGHHKNPRSVPFDPVPGITLAGNYNKANGKLESLPLADLEKIAPGYDLVLMEGDGSRMLPLKAWADNEPVVPSFTDFTVGVLPLWPLGKPVSEQFIHRLPLFLKLTGTTPGEPLVLEHLRRIITGSPAGADTPSGMGESTGADAAANCGLFAKARGKRILFFNQVEDAAGLAQARELADLLPGIFRRELCAIIAGSVKLDMVESLL
ncbi:MAG: selenium cofactor biosynthesis protein YqeC [Treponema sp.]|nr:selenium cofactor biosynthesis protein YqeC [Treponema sp.]